MGRGKKINKNVKILGCVGGVWVKRWVEEKKNHVKIDANIRGGKRRDEDEWQEGDRAE